MEQITKYFQISDIISLSIIVIIGLFELFYRHNWIDGYLALGIALGLFFYHIYKKNNDKA